MCKLPVVAMLLLGLVAVSDFGGAAAIHDAPVPVTPSSASTAVSHETLPLTDDQAPPVPDSAPVPEEPEKTTVPSESVVLTSDSASSQNDASAAPAAKTAGVRSTAAMKPLRSVPEQFRLYQDTRTVARLSKLFDSKAYSAAGIVQSPEIAVADGESLVTIAIELTNEVDTPSFSLKGANMKSIREISDNKWELDALPQRDKTDVRLSILLKGERTEISLVAVPSLNKTGSALLALTDGELDALLANPLTNNSPAYDLNADGKQDYLDDYILVAHWLLNQKRSITNTDVIPSLPVNDGSAK